MRTIFKNVLKAIGIICYFLILAYATTKMDMERLAEDIKIFSGAFLVIGLLILEIAYKQDNGKKAITGVEFLVMSLHSLSIMHIVNLLRYDLKRYLFISGIVISVYYIVKGIVEYTKERRKYLKDLSDISDIVKEDEPIVKEAKKREEQEETSEKKEKNIPKKSTKKSTTKKRTTTKKTTSSTAKKPSTKKSTTKVETKETKKPTTTKSTTTKSATKRPTKKTTAKATTTTAKKTKKEEVKEND